MSSLFRHLLAVLFASYAVIATAASFDAVRFTASPTVIQMRIEVRSIGGALLYDSGWKDGNLFDWPVQDGFGHPLAYGSYDVRVLSKDLAGQSSEKEATLR